MDDWSSMNSVSILVHVFNVIAKALRHEQFYSRNHFDSQFRYPYNVVNWFNPSNTSYGRSLRELSWRNL